MKVVLVAIVAGLWLAQGHASLARTIIVVLGAAVLTWAWVALGSARRAKATPAHAPVWTCPVVLHRACADRRIERKPRGRNARDVRCAAPRATARARRSTRR